MSSNLSDIEKELRQWRGDVIEAAIRGIYAQGLHLQGKARDLVPIETGDLSRSIKVVASGDGWVVTVFSDLPYAVRQHEDMTLRHDAGRRAKFLEIPFTTSEDEFLDILMRHVKEAM